MSLDFNKKYLNKSNGDINRNKVSIIIENEKFDREDIAFLLIISKMRQKY
jgi:hypothetical protein